MITSPRWSLRATPVARVLLRRPPSPRRAGKRSAEPVRRVWLKRRARPVAHPQPPVGWCLASRRARHHRLSLSASRPQPRPRRSGRLGLPLGGESDCSAERKMGRVVEDGQTGGCPTRVHRSAVRAGRSGELARSADDRAGHREMHCASLPTRSTETGSRQPSATQRGRRRRKPSSACATRSDPCAASRSRIFDGNREPTASQHISRSWSWATEASRGRYLIVAIINGKTVEDQLAQLHGNVAKLIVPIFQFDPPDPPLNTNPFSSSSARPAASSCAFRPRSAGSSPTSRRECRACHKTGARIPSPSGAGFASRLRRERR
jgi:hypothetical protein